MKSLIKEEINKQFGELLHISSHLYHHPEVSGREIHSAVFLAEILEKHGFQITKNCYQIDHAFQAEYDSGKTGASIGFFCEYDALPEIGHGCGHNLISAMSIGAALGLKPFLDQLGGKITVFGTPAEEADGAKVDMANQGAFNNLTAAMMVHPNGITEESGSSFALYPLEFNFYGKSSHAAMAPEKGLNALDGVIMLFNSLYALKNRYTNDVNIHGVISHGGNVANIIPDFAQARFYARAPKRSLLNEVIEEMKECGLGAAKMTGTRVEFNVFEAIYDDLNTNQTLSQIFNENLISLGENHISQAVNSLGSIDMGNVSQVAPAIHPWLGIGNPNLVIHTKDFADYTQSENGQLCLFKGACAMAFAAHDVMISPEIQEQILREFYASK